MRPDLGSEGFQFHLNDPLNVAAQLAGMIGRAVYLELLRLRVGYPKPLLDRLGNGITSPRHDANGRRHAIFGGRLG